MAITLDGTDGVTTTGLTSNGIDDNATSTAITIDSSQNVGIGTAAPESIVHIKDSGNVSTTLQIESAASQYAPTINFDGIVGASADYLLGEINGSWDTHTNVVSAIRFESGADTTNKDDGLISFWTSSSGPTLTEAMRIDSSGNVGIGTTTPNAAYALDVVGNIRATNSAGSTIIVNRTSNPGSVELQYSGTQTAQFSAVSGGGVATYVGSTPTEAMRVDASGNVVIGSGGLDVSGIGGTYQALNMRAGSGYPVLYGQTTATATNSPGLQIIGATSGASAGGAAEFLGIIQIAAESDSSTNAAGYMTFHTGSGGSAPERMRITSSGELLIGPSVTGQVSLKLNTVGSSYAEIEAFNFGIGWDKPLVLQRQAGEVWIGGTTDRGLYNLQVNNTGIWGQGSYVNGSDARWKDNVQTLDCNCLDIVNSLRSVSFTYNEDSGASDLITPHLGFIAQEVEQAAGNHPWLSGLVTEDPQGYKSMAYQELIPVLTKAIQEQQAMIEDLKSRLSAVEAN